MISRFTTRLAIGLALGLAATFLLAAQPAAAASPAWQVTSVARPTNFAPGDKDDVYRVLLTNIGDADVAGNVTIADALPPGLKAKSVDLFVSPLGNLSSGDCTLAPLRCELPGAIFSPEGQIDMLVHVSVPNSLAEGQQLTNTATVSGGGAPGATAVSTNEVSESPAPPGIQAFSASARNRDGSPYTQAGGHPYELSVEAAFNTITRLQPSGDIKDYIADLPAGLIGNPQFDGAAGQCSLAQYQQQACPPDSQVGTWATDFAGNDNFPQYGVIYNITPQYGQTAELAFELYLHLSFITTAGVRSGADYGVSTASPIVTEANIRSLEITIWGVPAAPSHDGRRRACLSDTFGGTCPTTAPLRPFLTMPTSCPTAPLSLGVRAEFWQQIGVFAPAADTLEATDGCNQLAFEPTLQARPTTNLADSPSGLNVDLHIPRGGLEEPENLAESGLRDATVTLPKGITVNPSSANGLAACTEQQVGYKPATSSPFEFTPDPAQCPDAAKLGNVEVDNPLLASPLPGAVYLAKQGENPFNSLLALYITVADPFSGIVVKLAGRVSADPQTGQLTTTFEENPQLPFEDFHLHFFGGAQGSLRTPATCDADPSTPQLDPYTTTSVLSPFSAPESGPPAEKSDEFQITEGPQGGACPHNAAEEVNKPTFHAGTETPQAGAFSPVSLKLTREDGSQELKGLDVTLPPGLSGKLAGIAECSEAQLAQAKSREHTGGGAEEQASPSCPLNSEVGTVEVGAGAGPTPLNVTGHAYLAGPYKGAPLSLAIVTPALAGPFDLGAVLVRTALYVDPETAQIHAVSDPLPTILDGIPLDLRSVTVKMSRPKFTLNPTNCNEMSFTGSAFSALGATASLTQRFQVGGCAALPFKPKLKLSLKGGTKRGQNPALKAVLTMKPGEANVARAQVTLPHSEFLDNAHIGTVCTRVQFAANQCPAASIYGHATALTPLLDQPLSGPVYLRSSSNKLPDLVADLNGQIHVVLDGRIDTGKGGGIRNTFEAVPDAPVTKFTLEMQGGNKGLLENTGGVCAKPQRAVVDFTGQNGKVSDTTPAIANGCKKAGGKGHKHKHRRGRAG